MKSNRTATIYALSDPNQKHAIRYVGCTTLTLNKRLAQHIKQKTNIGKRNWIGELQSRSAIPLIWELEKSDAESSKSKEDWWVRILQSQNVQLLNKTSLRITRNPRPQRNPKLVKKLTAESVIQIRKSFAVGITTKELAARFKVCRDTINMAVKRMTWRHIK